MVSAVIVCAGTSTRMDSQKNKVLLPLDGKPLFMHSVEIFSKFTNDVVVVANENDIEEISKYHSNVVLGGSNRQESVYNGIRVAKHENILIHDGARPFVSGKEISNLLELEGIESAFLGLPMFNTIKDMNTFDSLNRDNFVMSITPQLVKKDIYLKAYDIALEDELIYTDDVELIKECLKIKPQMVLGSLDNIKITTEADYQTALTKTSNIRIGHSWDCHKLVSGRKLILGGICIPFDKGLLGHSDADCLLHAISESLLGALSLGDLGTHFPDNDPKYKDIDSKLILKNVYELIKENKYKIINIDTMIYAENPKMKPYILAMREVISSLLEIDLSQISIKATTYEHMDAIGRGEAIACDSTVLLVKSY